MKETGAVLAGEMSGHIFFADRFFGFDDATYAGARVLEILSNTDLSLSALLATSRKHFRRPSCVSLSRRNKIRGRGKDRGIFARDHEVITIDGARILFENGWGLVRASNTQAILVLRFEADSDAALSQIRQIVEMKLGQLIPNFS
jgi:phosphomannomutase/phosphoglucomutase